MTMRAAALLGAIACLLTLGWGLPAAADYEDCRQWCDSHPSQCDTCKRKAGCGSGWKQVKSFRGAGRNWRACKKRGSWYWGNLDQCTDWCNDNPSRCETCMRGGCKAGYRITRKFKGEGRNYYACQTAERLSDQNWSRCASWCQENYVECARCSKLPGCGAGYKTIKVFKGKGKNWYACGDRGGSRDNYNECNHFCQRNERCVGCSRNPGCGAHRTAMKTFGGLGKNWYACRERNYRSGTLGGAED